MTEGSFIKKNFNIVSSTNDLLKEDLLKDNINKEQIYVYEAKGQERGRGRKGHTFVSEKGKGAFFSMLIPINYFNNKVFTISSALGVIKGLREIEGVCERDLSIKWVNDIFYKNKKVCGILTEGISIDNKDITHIIIGIGINLFGEFKGELQEKAIALNKEVLKKDEKKEELINRILKYILEYIKKDNVIEEYKKDCNSINANIRYMKDGIKEKGKGIDINENGNLVILNESGRIDTLNSGEIY